MSGDKRKSKVAAIAIIVLLWIIFLLFQPHSVIGDNSFISAILHHFFHGSIVHLAVNTYAAWILINRSSLTQMATAYVIATLSYFVAPIPCIGLSNILFALMGLQTPSLKARWWKSTNAIIFLAVMFGFLLVPKVSSVTHIVSFFGGVLVAIITRLYNNTISDYGKAKRERR